MSVAGEAPDGQLTPLLFDARGVRGAILRITTGVEAMFGHRDYPPDVRRLLGQACAAAPLLAAHLKFDGRLGIQLQNGSALPLMVVQVDHALQVRGMAKYTDGAAGGFPALARDGVLGLTLEPRGGQRYQAMVEVRGETLSDALEGYFEQSEQLPTRLCLAADDGHLAGLMLQRLPGREADDGWTHLQALFETLGEAELLALSPAEILHRLFHQEDLRVFEPRPVALRCSCSRAGISAMLLSLGEAELAPVLASQGQVEVGCEFCGAQYRYSPQDVAELFQAQHAEQGDQPLH